MKTHFDHIRVQAIGAALPAAQMLISELHPRFGEQEVKRIVCRTGIEAVRVAGALKTSDLCEAAARSVLAASTTDASEIDAIVLITQTPDYLMPATSLLLQQRLGLSKDCLAFDINYGCSGYIYGLYQAALLLRAGGCHKVLLCTGDVTSKLLHPDDRHVRLVFGDAGSATLLVADKREMGMDFVMKSDGGAKYLSTPIDYTATGIRSASVGHLHMNGTEIMNFALSEVPSLVAELLTLAEMTIDQVSTICMHQANAFMLNYLAKTMRVERSRVPVGMSQVGNTGPSSIPLLLAMSGGELSPKLDRAVLCGFGIGLSLGAVHLDLQRTLFVPPVDVAADGSVISNMPLARAD